MAGVRLETASLAGAVITSVSAGQEFLLRFYAQDLRGAFDIVINATASSLSGAGIPIPASALKAGALACDLMYGPAAQGFVDWARAHSATPRDGLGMLVEQAAEAFLVWRGVRPPAAQVLAELRASLS